MAGEEHIRKTLELVVAQIDDEERGTAEKKRAANELCRLLGQEVMFPDVDSAHSGLTTLPDEYYGRQVSDVIRSILEKRKKAGLGAATVAEIHTAMVQGGFHFQTKNPEYAKRGVYGVLADAGAFHRLPDGRYGLGSWYPAARTKQETAKKKQKQGGKGRKKKAKPEPETPES